MKLTVCTSIIYALNAIQNAPEDADIEPLLLYCQTRGLSFDSVLELTNKRGPVDHGRLAQHIERLRLKAIEADDATDTTLNGGGPEESPSNGEGGEAQGFFSRILSRGPGNGSTFRNPESEQAGSGGEDPPNSSPR